MNQLAPDHLRGRILGMYSAALCAGFALGPAVLIAAGIDGWFPFLFGAFCPLAAIGPLFIARGALPARGQETPGGFGGFLRLESPLLACVGAAAFAEQGVMSFLPVYARQEGSTVSTVAGALAIMTIGSIIFMYPIGWLADRAGRSHVITVCAVLAAVLIAFLPIGIAAGPALWALMFFWGGAYYSIYTLSLVLLGDRYTGADLAIGSAAFGAAWGVGGLLGPLLIGAAMETIGPAGFPVMLAIVFAALTFSLSGYSRKPAASRTAGKQSP